MCGVAGFVSFTSGLPNPDRILNAMGEALWRRGPDNHGIHVENEGQVGFVHRRLSIIDLSEAGNQPMNSADGRYLFLYNGEIYNHRQIKDELETAFPQSGWRGHSDTEVLLQAIQLRSLDWALEKGVGMWAFALWDRHDRKLVLARDRAGEKPLYYMHQRGQISFSSDLNALKKLPDFTGEIDRESLSVFLQCGFVPAPRTIFKDIKKVPSGAYVTIDSRGEHCTHHWSAPQALAAAKRTGFQGDMKDAQGTLCELLDQSIAGQMVADVPVGAFLSGGIDSTLVCARMQKLSKRPIRTYTIGFEDAAYNEAHFARAVAEHFGTDHTELYVSSRDAIDLIPEIPDIYSEPFADISQIPLVLVSRLARQDVTVALSGDGGDELFGGYNRHVFANGRTWKAMQHVPRLSRHLAGVALNRIGNSPLSAWMQNTGLGPRQVGTKLQKLSKVLEISDVSELHLALLKSSPPSDLLARSLPKSLAAAMPPPDMPDGMLEPAEIMMLHDFMYYMQDDVLTKVDRGAMSASLEVRAPFLDHRLVEFAFSLPLTMKIEGKTGKKVLRNVLLQNVPRNLFDRPKNGFTVPAGEWLRGPLKDWASELLKPEKIRDENYLDGLIVKRIWDEHIAGRQDHAQTLWNLVSFQAWLEKSA